MWWLIGGIILGVLIGASVVFWWFCRLFTYIMWKILGGGA